MRKTHHTTPATSPNDGQLGSIGGGGFPHGSSRRNLLWWWWTASPFGGGAVAGTVLPRRSSAGNIDAHRLSEIRGEAIRIYYDLYLDRDHRGHHGAQGRLLGPSLLVFHHPLGARSYGLVGCNLRPPPQRLRYVEVHHGVAPIRHAARRALTAGRRHDQDAILRSAHSYVFASPSASFVFGFQPRVFSARVRSGSLRRGDKDWPGRSNLLRVLRRTAARRRVSATLHPFR